MSDAVRPRLRLLLPTAVLVSLLLGLTFAAPTGGAIPASAVVGKVTYTELDAGDDLTTKIRSFSIRADQSGASGGGTGGGQGKVTFGTPRVVHDVVADSPLIMAAVASGMHLKTVVVTLYQPKSTKKSQVWTFTGVILASDEQVQKGPASKSPAEAVTWAFDKVTQTTYKSNGTTKASTFCFDVKQNKAC